MKSSIRTALNLILVAVCVIGCTSLTYDQSETQGVRTTKFRATSFWDAKSELAKLRLTNTDKTQSSSIGGLATETYATNAVAAFEAIAAGMMRGALGAVRPVP